MPKLTKANQARQNKALDKVYRFNGSRLSTYRQEINAGEYIGSEVADVRSVAWNRRKYNRMNAKEQLEYDAKWNILKKEYRLMKSNGSFSIVPKLVYDFFIQQNQK